MEREMKHVREFSLEARNEARTASAEARDVSAKAMVAANMATHAASSMHDVVAQATAAAQAAQAMPQPPSQHHACHSMPDPATTPAWTNWKQAPTQATPWLEKKWNRAVRHRAGIKPPPGITGAPALPMCEWCGRNQPGRFCTFAACKICCDEWRGSADAKECWQHGNSCL